MFVPSLARDDVADLYKFRAALEIEAARLAIRAGASLADAEKMVEQLEAMTGAESWAETIAVDLGFHREVVRAGGSSRLLRAYVAMSSELQLILARSQQHYDDPKRIGREHREILRALAGGDLAIAEQAIRYHLEVAVAELLTLFD